MNAPFKRGVVTVIVAEFTILFGAMPFVRDGAMLDNVSPQFGTNTAIVWQAPTNHFSAHFWTYKRLPQVFSAAAISNGIVLASFEKEGFFQAVNEQNHFVGRQHGRGTSPPYFSISSKYGQMSFTLGDRSPNSPADIPRDEAAVNRAFKCASLLGLDSANLLRTNTANLVLIVFF